MIRPYLQSKLLVIKFVSGNNKIISGKVNRMSITGTFHVLSDAEGMP